MPPPYVAIVVRGSAETPPTVAVSQLNERLREVIAPQEAPSKPRQGDVPARAAKMPIYSVLAMKQIRAVMYDSQSGVIGKTEFDQLVGSPRGKSLSWDERANIARKQPESYGSRFAFYPQSEDEARIRTLMGV